MYLPNRLKALNTCVHSPLVYQVTRPVVLTLLSVSIGISVTILIKNIVALILNKVNYQGFYRCAFQSLDSSTPYFVPMYIYNQLNI